MQIKWQKFHMADPIQGGGGNKSNQQGGEAPPVRGAASNGDTKGSKTEEDEEFKGTNFNAARQTAQGPRTAIPASAQAKTEEWNASLTRVSELIKHEKGDYYRCTFRGQESGKMVNREFLVNTSLMGIFRKEFTEGTNLVLTIEKQIEGRTQYVDRESNALKFHPSTREQIVAASLQTANEVYLDRTAKIGDQLMKYTDNPGMLDAMAKVFAGSAGSVK